LAFLRFARDKRGVENFYLVQPTTNRRGKVRPRVLYWFRSPPDVKVGREPFDPAVRRALEAQYPDVAFDWRAIIDTPIPSADADKWRERRRAERAAKHAVTAEESAEAAAGDEAADEAVSAPPDEAIEKGAVPLFRDAAAASPDDALTAPSAPGTAHAGAANRGKRRRRRSGGGRGGQTPPAPSGSEPSGE
jgi:hypothetical protein